MNTYRKFIQANRRFKAELRQGRYNPELHDRVLDLDKRLQQERPDWSPGNAESLGRLMLEHGIEQQNDANVKNLTSSNLESVTMKEDQQ